jgi:hypothetical protein
LHDAYFLFFEANIDICLQRILDRAAYPATQDDHFVSEEILRNYYRKDNKYYMTSTFATEFSLERERVAVIDNMGSWKEFGMQIKSFIEDVIIREDRLQNKTPTSPVTTSPENTEPFATRSPQTTTREVNSVQTEERIAETMVL